MDADFFELLELLEPLELLLEPPPEDELLDDDAPDEDFADDFDADAFPASAIDSPAFSTYLGIFTVFLLVCLTFFAEIEISRA